MYLHVRFSRLPTLIGSHFSLARAALCSPLQRPYFQQPEETVCEIGSLIWYPHHETYRVERVHLFIDKLPTKPILLLLNSKSDSENMVESW